MTDPKLTKQLTDIIQRQFDKNKDALNAVSITPRVTEFVLDNMLYVINGVLQKSDEEIDSLYQEFYT